MATRLTSYWMIWGLLLLTTAPPVFSQQLASRSSNLETTIQNLDRLLKEREAKSIFPNGSGPLLSNNPNFPEVDWVLWRKLVDGPFSRNLRSLVFHAACNENPTAISKAASLNQRFGGSLFSIEEVQYLQALATHKALNVTIDDDPLPRRQDLESINRRRNMTAALKAGNFQTALRLAPRLNRLCQASPN
ncbi:MAG: hypothetical protein RIC14_14670 [Filomicrobium sp.]